MNGSAIPVSVVIASRNRRDLVADAVRSIAAGSTLPAEIIVIDQSDDQEPPPAWRVPGTVPLRHLHMPALGVSAARNAGAKAAKTPLLAFLDDDMWADPTWLSSLTRVLVSEGPGTAVTGRVRAGEPEREGAFVAATADRTVQRSYSGRLPIDVLAGGNMGMYRDAFMRVGGFDERLGPGTRFPAAEDNDLGFRLLDAGLRIVFVPEAVLVHRAWREPHAYVALRFAYGLGKGGFYIKHTHLTDLHMPGRLARDLVRRGVTTVRSALHPRRALGEMAYAAGIVTGACEWLVRRG